MAVDESWLASRLTEKARSIHATAGPLTSLWLEVYVMTAYVLYQTVLLGLVLRCHQSRYKHPTIGMRVGLQLEMVEGRDYGVFM